MRMNANVTSWLMLSFCLLVTNLLADYKARGEFRAHVTKPIAIFLKNDVWQIMLYNWHKCKTCWSETCWSVVASKNTYATNGSARVCDVETLRYQPASPAGIKPADIYFP